MTPFLAGCLLGGIIGGTIGVVAMAICVAAGSADHAAERREHGSVL